MRAPRLSGERGAENGGLYLDGERNPELARLVISTLKHSIDVSALDILLMRFLPDLP
jgi:hypothetical protein